MAHINERVLKRLLNHKMSESDIDAVMRHSMECRDCAQRLEEWRDHFDDVASQIPDPTHLGSPVEFPQNFVLVPSDDSDRPSRFDWTNVLWVTAVMLALVVGYSASRLLREPSDGLGTAPIVEFEPQGEGTRPTSLTDTTGRQPDPSAHLDSPSVQATGPKVPPVPTPPSTQRQSLPPPAAETSLGASPPTDASVTMPGFRRVPLGEAAHRLDGDLRFLSNLTPDHVEIGPGSAVPGALASQEIVRVVYVGPDGSKILLDQQRIPVDASGFRPINDAALENGDTLLGSSPQGVSLGTWVDSDGYRMSVAAHASADSLKRLIQRVR